MARGDAIAKVKDEKNSRREAIISSFEPRERSQSPSTQNGANLLLRSKRKHAALGGEQKRQGAEPSAPP